MRATKVLFWLAQLAGVAATVGLLWGSELPLGVAGEWVWDRIAFDQASFQELQLGWIVAGVATLVYAVVCLFADRRVLEANRWEMSGWLLALVLLGSAWQHVVQECPPDPHRLSKVSWVLWYRSTQGYYEEARFRAADDPQYLAKYEERLKEGDVLHFGTHPPGLVLLHQKVINFVKHSPKLQKWMLQYQPESFREGLDVLAENSARSPNSVTDLDRAALWLAGLLASLAAMSTVVPLFCLMRHTCGRETSWRLVCLWPLVPALSVFHPVSDLWLPFAGTLFLATWARAWSHRSWLFGVLAGIVMWGGLMLSLALLPVAFLAALWTLADAVLAESADPLAKRAKQLAICVASALGAFVVLCLLAKWQWSLNLAGVWLQNFRNHAGFYDQYTRTTSRWLLVNPFELAFAIGTPIFLTAVSTWIACTRGSMKSGRSFASFRWWVFVTLCVLWLSGKNSGEAARLWIFLMPWLLWVSGRETQGVARVINGPGQTLPEFAGTDSRGWLTVLVLQAVVCISTVSRVDGFHFKTTVPLVAVPAASPQSIDAK